MKTGIIPYKYKNEDMTKLFEEGANYGSIAVISRHQTLRLSEKIDGLSVLDEAEIGFFIQPLNWYDQDKCNKFEFKIYYFDDLDEYKLNNIDNYYSLARSFDLILTPRLDEAFNLKRLGFNVMHMPYGLHQKSMPKPQVKQDYLFLDVFTNKLSIPQTEWSHRVALKFMKWFSDYNPLNYNLYLPSTVDINLQPFKNVKKIDFLPYFDFLRFISSSRAYISTIYSSYEFVPLECAFYDVPVISVDGLLKAHHKVNPNLFEVKTFDDWVVCYDNIASIELGDSGYVQTNNYNHYQSDLYLDNFLENYLRKL